MLEEYPGVYRDRWGEEKIVVRNDGTDLHMTLRGVEFWGHDISGMEPRDKAERPELAPFVLNRYPYEAADLCACAIDYEMILPISDQGRLTTGRLAIHAELGEPAERGMLDREFLRLALTISDETYQGSGTSGWFEDELLEIQVALPDAVYMRACINCAFSDYSVYGHGLFGNMLCFRDQKAAYLAVRDKDGYMDMMDGFTETVQETYLCPEFERRTPGTGYRG